MNYRNPRLRAVLAAEYAFGTLHGGARRRFEQLLRDDLVLRREVEQWQNDVYPALIEALPERAPPARVWQRIDQHTRPAPKPARTERPGLWRSLNFWRGLALAASAAVLVLALNLVLRPPVPPAGADYIAVIQDRAQRPAWLVRLDRDQRRFRVETLQAQNRAADRSFELWLLPGGQQPPRSLGLLPAQGDATLALPPALTQALPQAQALAVSLEPAGGSPTGRPTGPVLYQGSLLRPDAEG